MAHILTGSKATVLSSLASDPDGDSLVYSLQAPTDQNGSPMVFATFSPTRTYLINPQDSSQIAFFKTGSQQLSPTFPMPSYVVNWAQPAPRYVNQVFSFNSQNGSFNFHSPAEISNTPYHGGNNRYAMVVQVDEYRNIAGLPVKVGSVRRNMLVLIGTSGVNENPAVSAPVVNGQLISPETIINLRPGTPLMLTFSTTDSNANDTLLLESNVADLLPGAVFTKTTGNRPAGIITWTPSPTHVRDQIHYFNIVVQDNACPVKGIHQQTFGVRVSNSGGVTGTSKALDKQTAFTAYPNPFGNTVTFKVKQSQPNQQILIYNVLGQQVDQLSLTGNVNAEQEVIWINAARFPAGQYVARFNNGNGQALKINKLQ
ncbi:MAG TPA: T9SS type A sorting domain-containing protein, partial [Adhaeribacter sp.]|nr:T9SS type A sorting domain-containing protein [Adhaeribacter sp.]